MDRPSPELVHCPSCGAMNFAIDEICSSCEGPLTVFIGPKPKVRHVSLSSVMIVIAVVAVCIAPIRIAPGFTIFLLLILVPTTVRGFLAIAERKAEGRPMMLEEKVQIFVGSAMIMFLMVVVAGIAFVVTCVPVSLLFINSIYFRTGTSWLPGMILAFGSGFIAAGAVIFWAGKTLWPRKD